MAFLDRMVSDLIRSSTGFNARPFVRAIGGKNLLLLGGAAVAGALAVEKIREGQKPGVTTPPPPLPPLPQQGGPPPPLPVPPPPVPQAVSSDDEIPNALLFAIIRTLVAGALADGEMHTEEKALIESRLDESGLTPEQIQRVHKDMVIPPQPGELAALVTTGEDRELLYRFGALVVMKDGELTAHERGWLDRLAAALALPADRCLELEREIFGSN